MKVKLLKKLRKRFIWYYDDKKVFSWQLYDKKEDKQLFGLPDKGNYETERLILKMMQILGNYKYWYSRHQKFEKIRIAKLNKETKELFYSKQV